MFWPDAFHLPGDEGPSGSVTFDHGEKFNIFLKTPICFFDVRVEVADPFFSAHGECLEVVSFWAAEEGIRDGLPFWLIFFFTE